MANSVTQVCFSFDVQTEEAEAWLKETLDNPPDELYADWMEDEDRYLEFDYSFYEDAGGLQFCICDDGGEINVDTVIAFLQAFLKADVCDHERISFAAAFYSMPSRVGECGGAAYIVTRNDVEAIDTFAWLHQRGA